MSALGKDHLSKLCKKTFSGKSEQLPRGPGGSQARPRRALLAEILEFSLGWEWAQREHGSSRPTEPEASRGLWGQVLLFQNGLPASSPLPRTLEQIIICHRM